MLAAKEVHCERARKRVTERRVGRGPQDDVIEVGDAGTDRSVGGVHSHRNHVDRPGAAGVSAGDVELHRRRACANDRGSRVVTLALRFRGCVGGRAIAGRRGQESGAGEDQEDGSTEHRISHLRIVSRRYDLGKCTASLGLAIEWAVVAGQRMGAVRVLPCSARRASMAVGAGVEFAHSRFNARQGVVAVQQRHDVLIQADAFPFR